MHTYQEDNLISHVKHEKIMQTHPDEECLNTYLLRWCVPSRVLLEDPFCDQTDLECFLTRPVVNKQLKKI